MVDIDLSFVRCDWIDYFVYCVLNFLLGKYPSETLK